MNSYFRTLLVLTILLPIACKQQEAPPVSETAPDTALVSGTIAYRERIALSPHAIVEITLQDVSLADAPAKIIAKQRITNPGQVPIQFELVYQPEDIDDRMSYTIQARILEGERLMFINDTHTPVLTRGAENQVEMMLVRVQGAPPSASISTEPEDHASLTDTYWKLLELGGEPVTTPEGMREAHVILALAESRAHGFAGCNNFFGGYQSEGESLTFSAMGATMMACPEGMDTEQTFLSALGKTTRYKISGQFLQIYAGDHLLARLEAVYL